MTAFTHFILYHLKSSLPVLMLGAALALLILIPCYIHFRKKYGHERKFPWWKALLFLLFSGYIGVLISTTMLGRTPSYAQYANFYLFRAWRDAWNNFSRQSWLNVLINIAMFMPLGFCLPLLSKRLGQWYYLTLIGFCLSGVFEAVQYFTGIGLMDVDDLFCNTLGAFLGGCIVLALLSLKKPRNRKKFWAFMAGPLLLVLLLCGIFLTYSFKEYGNIILAPGYRQKMSGVSIELSCSLGDEERIVPVYRAQGFTKDESSSFAEKFLQGMGFEPGKAHYYDDSAVYFTSDISEASAVMYVNYIDGSYSYDGPGKKQEAVIGDASEAMLKEKLEQAGVVLPAQTEFMPSPEGGYIFSAEQLRTEDGMYDGSLSCSLDEKGDFLEINQFLIYYEKYAEEKICSEQEAYSKLCKGDFSGPEWFPGDEPEFYEINGCRLEYRIDSKGFYRPVYIFSALVDGQNVGGGLLVTAD